ncbi:hypothetical protein J3E69DRAFT_264400 [Trichoderma sp. SZMC 28015]
MESVYHLIPSQRRFEQATISTCTCVRACVACNRVLQARSKPLIAGSYIRVRCKPHQYDVQRQSSVWSSYILCPLGLDCLCTHKRCGTGLIEIGETLPFTRTGRCICSQRGSCVSLLHDPGFDSHGQGASQHTLIPTHRVTRVPTCLRASYGAIPPRSAGHASGIGSKASIGRDLCNDTSLPPPWSFIPSLGICTLHTARRKPFSLWNHLRSRHVDHRAAM